MGEDFITRQELANILRCCIRTVHNYERSGAIPAPVKVGRRHLWSRLELIAFIKAQRHSGQDPLATAISEAGK